ncbi:MAG TPA: hypothetical protein VIB82_04770, partial [Caulobacteraceae bacterium]
MLSGAGLIALAGSGATAQVTPPPNPVESLLLAAAVANLHPIAVQGQTFSGPGWDLLVSEGAASEFVL